MEQRHLRYFVAVAEELHFGRAARRLGISQPPLSQQIQALERELGVDLFRRTGRRVELTHAGAVFLGRSRAILAAAQDAARAARRAAIGEIGQLTVGFIHAATFTLLPGILRRFRERLPNVELDLRELASGTQVDALAEGRLDLGFLRPPIVNAAVRTAVLLEEPLVVGMPHRHRLAGRPTIALRELAVEPMVLFTPHRSPLYGQVLSACLAAGFSPNVVQEATHIMTIIALVRAGLGVALLPASAAAVRMEGIRYRTLDYTGPRAQTALAWRSGEASPLVLGFLESAGVLPERGGGVTGRSRTGKRTPA
jgi:DNA-binding transcriptional LysR family regulator